MNIFIYKKNKKIVNINLELFKLIISKNILFKNNIKFLF